MVSSAGGTVQTSGQQEQQHGRQHRQQLHSRLSAGSNKRESKELQRLPANQVDAVIPSDGDGLRSSTAQFLYGTPILGDDWGAEIEKYAFSHELRPRKKRGNGHILLKWGAKKGRTAFRRSTPAKQRDPRNPDGNSIFPANGDLEGDALSLPGQKAPLQRPRPARGREGNTDVPNMIFNEITKMVAPMETCSIILPQSPAAPVTPVPSKQKRSQKRKSLSSLGDVRHPRRNLDSITTHSGAGEKLLETDSSGNFADRLARPLLNLQQQEALTTLPCAFRSPITSEKFQVQRAEWADPALECGCRGNQNDCAVAECDGMFGKNGLSAERELTNWHGTRYQNSTQIVENTLSPTQQQQYDNYLQGVIQFTDAGGNGYSYQRNRNLSDIATTAEDSSLDPPTPLKCRITKKGRSASKLQQNPEEILSFIGKEPIPPGWRYSESAALLENVESVEAEISSVVRKSRSRRGEPKISLDLNEPASQMNDGHPIPLSEEPPDPNPKKSRKHPRPRVLKDVTKPARVPKPKKPSNPRKAPSAKAKRPKKTKPQAGQMKQQGGGFPSGSCCEGQVENLLREDSLSHSPKPWRMKKAARSRKSFSIQTVEGYSDRSVHIITVGIACLQLDDAQSKAIVPFSNRQTAIVPHAKLRQKFKPKVQLEEGDLQWWKLVMTHGPSYEDKSDGATTEKWATERKLFKDRAVEFIGLMHQVQGNRRFSKWKGSIIDSVVGAFLTQNVSDHLSSSAFMLLAAKFPVDIFREVRVEETFEPGESVTSFSTRHADNEPRPQVDYIVEDPPTSEDHDTVEEPPVIEIPSTVEELEEEHIEFWHSAPKHPVQDFQTDVESLHQAGQITTNDVEGPNSGEFKIRYGLEDENPSRSSLTQEDEGNNTSICYGPEEVIAGNSSIDPAQSSAVGQLPSENLSPVTGKEKVSYIGLTGPERAKLEQNKTKSKDKVDWEEVRKSFAKLSSNGAPQGSVEDAVNWQNVRATDVGEIAEVIKERGMNNMLAGRIKGFLNRLQNNHGRLDLEWLRDIPPEQAKKFLLSIHGLGLKSAECVRLLTLHHLAFPVDTNVGRICVRLGWVPIEPLPEVKLLSELETYPVQENIQKYLWPRLCTLDQPTLYELHYQLITFGKVFCTKRDPNCHACPMRNDCRHFADSKSRSRTLELTLVPEQRGPGTSNRETLALPAAVTEFLGNVKEHSSAPSVPIIDLPASPARLSDGREEELDDSHKEGVVPEVTLHLSEVPSNALVIVPPDVAAQPVPRLKSVGRLRTVHYVYELNDDHPLLKDDKIGARVPDDPCPILLAIWSPGESPDTDVASNDTFQQRKESESSLDREETVKGTFLVPCRTANRGSFPLNGTYFQVNEVFADHHTSINPMDVPRRLLWNLTRRFVYFGTSVTSIFKGLTVEEITYAFQYGYVCVRGFDSEMRTPKPLQPRLHLARFVSKKKQKQSEHPEKKQPG